MRIFYFCKKVKMKRIILAFCFLAHAFIMAQSLEFSALADNYNMSVRAIQIWQNKVYYAPTDSKFGYIHLKEPTIRKQMKLSDANLQFRTLAQTDNLFYTVNIESPATFYKITKSTFTAEEVFTDTIKLHFMMLLCLMKKEEDWQ